MRYFYSIGLIALILSCKRDANPMAGNSTCYLLADSAYMAKDTVLPEKVVAFAKTLLGTPYKFGCTAPSTGFDCSGFITYVFNHFSINVPRSSVDFTNEGTPIALQDAAPGDLILFTGTNKRIKTVGHIGLIIANDTSGVSFIHSSSGNENSVIITPLNGHYMARFVKVIRIIKK